MKKVMLFMLIMILAMLLVFAMSSVALAADGDGESVAAGVNWTDVLIALVPFVFAAIISPLIKAAFVWVKSKTENEAILTALNEASIVADNVVARLQAKVVNGLKENSADGKLSIDDAKNVMKQAIDMFCSDISQGALDLINKNADNAAEYIQNLIESRLFKLKASQADST
jgi:hypothetical protein